MTAKPDNPPAFPIPDAFSSNGERVPGMSLRDYAAIKIVAGWCANSNPQCGGPYVQMAAEAYRLADAMLAERTKTDDR